VGALLYRGRRMGKDRGKPTQPPVPPGEGENDLVTSDDLFGDLVDAPSPPDDRRSARRDRPIRVRLEDPVSPQPFVAPAGEDSEEGPPPPQGPAPEGPVFHPAPPRDDDAEARLRPGVVNTSAPLAIAAPKVPVRGGGLDLAPVAESGLEERGAPERKPRPPAGTASAEKATWRADDLGPYRLVDRVAVGGMAEVFKAKRSGVEGFEKTVALKRILPHLSENKEFLEMFVDEAKMVAGLSHPSIVQIYDLGKIEDSYYIAMEYVHGRDLRTILKRAREKGLRMPLDLTLRVASQVSAALEYAHRKKDERGRPMEIVHRDVSPQNILISFEGDVKLADFGIAKAATKASNTDRGALRGKLLYMSPEQAWGRPIDRRSDVFSVGIVLYEMVTEQKPFQALGSDVTILELVRKCVITPPRDLNPRVPEPLDRLIMKALAREPEDRYRDAGELHRGIERILRERPPVTAHDLARFLELLFDRREREENGLVEHHGVDPGAGEQPSDPLSLDVLLKRFGID
jgi:serine/threonine protein kinase